MKKLTWSHAASYGLILILLVLVLHPFLWLLISTFKTEQELLKYPPTFLSDTYILSQYANVWDRLPLVQFFKNTLIFSVGVMIFSVFFRFYGGVCFCKNSI